MKPLPLTDKNAYLVITSSPELIYANLFYSHYEIGRNYVLSDISHYPDNLEALSNKFWADYFKALEEKFSWSLFQEDNVLSGVFRSQPFVDEGNGVAKVTTRIADFANGHSAVIRSLREFSPDIEVDVYSHDDNEKYHTVLEKLGYEDILVLDLNLLRFDAWRIGSAEGISPHKMIHTKISWTGKNGRNGLMKSITDSRLKAFLSTSRRLEEIQNVWANLVSKRPLETSDVLVSDLIRAFTTLQLTSLDRQNSWLTRNFGLGSRSAIILTGDISKLIAEDALLLAIIDGLQLRGHFDVFIDSQDTTRAGLAQLFYGVNAQSFILNPEDVFKNPVRVFIPSVSKLKRGARKLVFDALLTYDDRVHDHVFAFVGDFLRINLSNANTFTLQGEFKKEFSPFVKGEPLTVATDSRSPHIVPRKIIVDARVKPIVYGPSARANHTKLMQWLN